MLAVTAGEGEPADARAQILAARLYAAKLADDEARKRLSPILAQREDPAVLRKAAEALVHPHLPGGECEQAITTLSDLRPPSKAHALPKWGDDRLKANAGEQ